MMTVRLSQFIEKPRRPITDSNNGVHACMALYLFTRIAVNNNYIIGTCLLITDQSSSVLETN